MGVRDFNSQAGDKAEVAGFSTDANLNLVAPGATFQATWTFKNSGTTTWNGDYRFSYSKNSHPKTRNFSRSPLGAQLAQSIVNIGATGAVKPGEKTHLTLTLTAPDEPGTYTTNWQLQTGNGRFFGPIRWLRAVVVVVGKPLAYIQTVPLQNSVSNSNHMQPGRQFSGTWTLRNSGWKTWSGDFQIAYIDQAINATAHVARNQMGAPSVIFLRELTGHDEVKPNEIVPIRFDLTAPLHPGAYALHWELRDANGRSFGGVRWLQIGVVRAKPPREKLPFQPGMNINPEVHELDIERLRGLTWVRYPFFASRLRLSPEEAYHQRYRHIIQAYATAGVGSLLVLHQDTEWGNAPWDHGGWDKYATTFAQACGRVAKACAEFGNKVAYQIFNEQDSPPSNPAAIAIPAEHFAPILEQAVQAIRTAHPGATIVIGGLNTGPDQAIRYVKEVQRRLGGRLPVDALACHPYGRYVHTKVFNVFGSLSEVLDKFKRAFPDKPMWITEFGLPGHATRIGPEHYPKIATYLREVTAEVTDNYADYVQALIWFAWTDRMENAGILTTGELGSEKANVYDAFLEMKSHGRSLAKAVGAGFFADTNEAAYLSNTSTLSNLNAVPAGTQFTNRWRFKNIGSLSWDDNYKIRYAPSGDHPAQMTSKQSYKLSEIADKLPVEPGDTVELSLNMTAPDKFGRTYRSNWQLCDAQGSNFAYLYEELTILPAPTAD